MTTFTFDSTALEVIDGVDLSGKRALVTGGASGLGIETARALAVAGAEVTIAVRDVAAGEKVAADLGHDLRVARLDLADPVSVDAFVQSWDGPLHLLVNNAGVMACPETYNLHGWELQLATNHLGHWRLATGLHSSLAAEGARVVSVSSRGHWFSDVVFDDLMFAQRDYDPWLAYGQSKTANILFALEADRRWAGDGIRVNACHPGRIITNLIRHLTPEMLSSRLSTNPTPTKTPEQGAATQVLLAASPVVEGRGGRYFEDCHEAVPSVETASEGVRDYALDPTSAARLWDVSAQLFKEIA